MAYDSPRYHCRSIRLKGYDYSQTGAYFITLCTERRVCLFGDVVGGEMQLNPVGRMVETVWNELPYFYPGIAIDGFVVMPNHIHGIIWVGAAPCGRPDSANAGQSNTGQSNTGQPRGVAPTVSAGDGAPLSLPDVVHRFKTLTTKRYVDGVK